ncbi:hypothetical protein ACFYNO_07430 [Kitasatospora sp. NPDC006697]|uniref:hypothetical protein n=1 Tax=Kitasatospora sp. NPDC006697 TaxID=3364020 RepID=UPI003678F278
MTTNLTATTAGRYMAASHQLRPISASALGLLLFLMECTLGGALFVWTVHDPGPGKTHNPLITATLIAAMTSAAAITVFSMLFAAIPPRRRLLCWLSALLAASLAVIGAALYQSDDAGASNAGVLVCGTALFAVGLADTLRARPRRTSQHPSR